LNTRDIARHRLWNHGLATSQFATPEDAVRWFGGVQSQEYGVAKWSVGQRVKGATEALLDRAIESGSILRTHVLRPTWHFVHREDIRWILELTAPRVHAMCRTYYKQLGLGQHVLARSDAAIARALANRTHLTRPEISALLRRARITSEPLVVGFLLMHAELEGIICNGTPRGTRQTYALVDECVPRSKSLPRDEAIAELARRYFTSHGPATLNDFRWWSSLGTSEARQALEMIKKRLEQVVVSDRTYWFDSALPQPRRSAPKAYLLQAYDEYMVAYRESRDVVDASRLAGREEGALLVRAVILDGQLVGQWRRRSQGRKIQIEVTLLRPLGKTGRDAVKRAVEHHGRFMDSPVELVWI
jgi:hypothetical protein